MGWEGASRLPAGQRFCDHCARWIELDSHRPGWTPRRWGSQWVWVCPQCNRDLRGTRRGRLLPVRGIAH